VLDLLSALVEYLLGSLNRLPGEAVEPAEDSVPSSHPLTIDNSFNTGLILEYVCVEGGGVRHFVVASWKRSMSIVTNTSKSSNVIMCMTKGMVDLFLSLSS
jgi:hypothetical protein